MEVLENLKTARFAKVVESCGRPGTVFLWTDPDNDPEFRRALKQNRIMSVRQETVGNRKDYGFVGFRKEKSFSYLVFPKPLDRFAGKRIIGIKYDLVNTPGPVGHLVKEVLRRPPAEPQSKPAPRREERSRNKATPRPPVFRYRVKVRYTATAELTHEVEAGSLKAAREQALRAAPPDLSQAGITRKVIRTARKQ